MDPATRQSDVTELPGDDVWCTTGQPKEGSSKASNSICPSKSTVYLGNISYSLTNNDLAKCLEHCGKIVCVKIVKDRVTRESKGYAFIQFLKPEDAQKCIVEYNGTTVFGRKWSCSIAKDNGRTRDFITKRTYPDKSRCYECGEFGHLSYKCVKNLLGDREPPPKKKKAKRNVNHNDKNCDDAEESDASDSSQNEEMDSLSAAIKFERAKVEEEEYRENVASGRYLTPSSLESKEFPKKRYVKDKYFSDEEDLTDD